MARGGYWLNTRWLQLSIRQQTGLSALDMLLFCSEQPRIMAEIMAHKTRVVGGSGNYDTVDRWWYQMRLNLREWWGIEVQTMPPLYGPGDLYPDHRYSATAADVRRMHGILDRIELAMGLIRLYRALQRWWRRGWRTAA